MFKVYILENMHMIEKYIINLHMIVKWYWEV